VRTSDLTVRTSDLTVRTSGLAVRTSGLRGPRGARRHERDEGSAAIELAVIAPSLIVLIFFVIQGGLYLYGRSVALQSAREGVSQLRLAQSQTAYTQMQPGVADNVRTFASTIGKGALDGPVVVSAYDDQAGRVSVTVTGTTMSLIPFATFTVTETARGTVEKFR
jgi:Flp pilus assembly protein TadG